MACYLFPPRQYLNQCWLIYDNKFQWKFSQNTKIFVPEMSLKCRLRNDGYFVTVFVYWIVCLLGRTSNHRWFDVINQARKMRTNKLSYYCRCKDHKSKTLQLRLLKQSEPARPTLVQYKMWSFHFSKFHLGDKRSYDCLISTKVYW